jgi:hypothetical protein
MVCGFVFWRACVWMGVQVGMEHSDAAELLAQKVRSKFHKVNMNFRVSHFETHPRGYEHAVSDFNREKAYG